MKKIALTNTAGFILARSETKVGQVAVSQSGLAAKLVEAARFKASGASGVAA